MISTRLVAYQPNGARIGVLPDPAGHSGHMPVNGVSALKVDYFKDSEGSQALANPVEVALEVSAGGAWVEPANARFLRIVRDRDGVDKSGLWSFAMPGYGLALGWACVLPAKSPTEANTDPDGKRKFLSANAGTIIKTVIDEARGLDARVLEGLTYDFTTSKDSSGANWSKIITIFYDPGLGLDSIISNLADQGVIDWEMQGRTLRVFNPDTALARKRPQVRIHDLDTAAAPMKGTLEGLKHLVLLKGDDGKLWTKENVSAPTPWGKTISFITQGGVTDEGTASTLIQAELDAGSRERVQYTRALELGPNSPVPFTDYRPGDFITARNADGVWESMRVFALGLGRDNGKHTVTLTLNDLFEDALIRQAKRTKGIVGGATTDGGSGARPAPVEPGKRKPQAPAGLVMNSDHYFDQRGVAHASVLASYAPATAGEDGLGLTIQAHELFGRQVGSTNPFRMLTSVAGSEPTMGFSPLPVQTHWDFKVRAVAENGVPSDWSNTVRIELARDITPPPVASTPVLTTRLGTVTVTWDGLTELGTQMPADFDYCEIEITDHTGNEDFIAVGELRQSAGLTQFVIADLPYKTATQVRLIAIDSSGNRAEPSEIATISTEPLVDADLIETTVFDAMSQLEVDLAEGMTAVNQGIADVDDKVTTAQTTADGKNTVYRGPTTPAVPAGGHKTGDTWFDTASGDTVIKTWDGTAWAVQALAAESIAANAITAIKIAADAVTAVKIAARTITADRIAVNAITANEIAAFTITAQEIAGRTITAAKIVGSSITAFEIAALTITANEIRANAITTDKILAGAITTIKLQANAIDTSRLDADAITAKHTITGALIQTTATALRGVKINSGGLFAYDSSGQQTVSIYSASGNATVTGTVQTGLGDNQVVMSDNVSRGRPGVRMYTGANDGHHPVLQAMGTGANDGFPAGATLLLGAETRLNSSGRADLSLERGGDFMLRQHWGSNSGIGIQKIDEVLALRGKLPNARSGFSGGTFQMEMVRGADSISPGSSWRWTLIPRPTGTTEAIPNPKSIAAQSARPIMTHDSSASSVEVFLGRDSNVATGFSVLIGWNA